MHASQIPLVLRLGGEAYFGGGAYLGRNVLRSRSRKRVYLGVPGRMAEAVARLKFQMHSMPVLASKVFDNFAVSAGSDSALSWPLKLTEEGLAPKNWVYEVPPTNDPAAARADEPIPAWRSPT